MTRFLTGLLGPGALVLTLAGCNVSTQSQSSAAVQSTTSPTSTEQVFNIYLTGYSYWDNTPPASAEISKPVIHRRAGGSGTYNDPITIAVGHVIVGNRQTLDYRAGTKFYLKRLRKYAIVEDVCGDGARPQDGPCHTGKNGMPWMDIYVDGKGASAGESTQCAYRITGTHPIIMNPRRDYPVEAGALTATGCQVYSG